MSNSTEVGPSLTTRVSDSPDHDTSGSSAAGASVGEVGSAAGSDVGNSVEDIELSQLLDLLPGALCVCNRDGEILRYNRCATELWGRTPRIRDQKDRFCGAQRLHRMDGGPLPHSESPMAEVLRTGVPARNREIVIERPGGSRIVALVNVDPLRNHAGQVVGAVNCFRDVTENAEAARQRREAEQAARLLASIVESSHDAIVSKDLAGTITSWNRGAERLFGYRADDAIGQSITIIIPSDRRDEEAAILERIRGGSRVEDFETVRQRKDGDLVHISLTVSPVRDADGRIVGASKIARDITERRQARERHQLLLQEMSHRVKNAFALASSVVALTLRFARGPDEIGAAIRDRLGALARAHELILPGESDGQGRSETPTTLDALIRTVLAPYKSSDGPLKFVIEGRDVPVGSKTVSTLALLIQEFATNAAKYGALSMPDGRVEITWAEDHEELVLTWTEHGCAPLAEPPAKEGFGSFLTRATVTGELQGHLAREWRPDGLCVRLSVPRGRLAL